MSESRHTTKSQRANGNFWKVEVRVSGDQHVVMSDIIADINILFNRHSPDCVFQMTEQLCGYQCIFYIEFKRQVQLMRSRLGIVKKQYSIRLVHILKGEY